MLPLLKEIGIIRYFPPASLERIIVLLLVSSEIDSTHNHAILGAKVKLGGIHK